MNIDQGSYTHQQILPQPETWADAIRNAFYLPVGPLLSCESSLSKGLDPDRSNHLEIVIRLSQVK
ncbi:MAG: hypothetical protein ABSB41_03435 [Anaerolineales bacterium]|jgi:hypothetical protein